MAVSFQPADLLSVAKAAKALDISKMTLYRWLRAKLIDSVEVGGLLCIPKTEVERLKAEGLPFEKPSASTGG